MKKSKFTKSQIIKIVNEADAGVPVPDFWWTNTGRSSMGASPYPAPLDMGRQIRKAWPRSRPGSHGIGGLTPSPP